MTLLHAGECTSTSTHCTATLTGAGSEAPAPALAVRGTPWEELLQQLLLAGVGQKQNQHGAGDEEGGRQGEGGADADLSRESADRERRQGAKGAAAIVRQALAGRAHGRGEQLGEQGPEQAEI